MSAILLSALAALVAGVILHALMRRTVARAVDQAVSATMRAEALLQRSGDTEGAVVTRLLQQQVAEARDERDAALRTLDEARETYKAKANEATARADEARRAGADARDALLAVRAVLNGDIRPSPNPNMHPAVLRALQLTEQLDKIKVWRTDVMRAANLRCNYEDAPAKLAARRRKK